MKLDSITFSSADPGEVKGVNFHPPPRLFFWSPSFLFFFLSSNIEIIFNFSDIITKIHPPFQNPGSALDFCPNPPSILILHCAYEALTRCEYCMCFLRHGINEDVCDHLGHEQTVTSRFARIEKFSLNFSNSLFVFRVNLLHP